MMNVVSDHQLPNGRQSKTGKSEPVKCPDLWDSKWEGSIKRVDEIVGKPK